MCRSSERPWTVTIVCSQVLTTLENSATRETLLQACDKRWLEQWNLRVFHDSLSLQWRASHNLKSHPAPQVAASQPVSLCSVGGLKIHTLAHCPLCRLRPRRNWCLCLAFSHQRPSPFSKRQPLAGTALPRHTSRPNSDGTAAERKTPILSPTILGSLHPVPMGPAYFGRSAVAGALPPAGPHACQLVQAPPCVDGSPG